MTITLYNTLTRRVEPLETLLPDQVSMYICGVTVYDQAHIGHAMSALVFDTIRRYLQYRGYSVQHIVNFTDVDDKIINRANALGRDPQELAASYASEFLADLAALSVLPATAYPRVTESMDGIRDFIARLIDQGYAYPLDGDVYFRVSRDEDYGKLSGRKLADMLHGTRVEADARKESPADFALWKGAKAGEPAWPSPWGPGRPGWHIECSAMSLAHLGEQIDIHGGGTDLIFPHHENEIAQTESLTGKPFARYWMHNGMLMIQTKMDDGTFKLEKMSKSLGNVVSIQNFLAQHHADVLRMIVLASSYRSPLAYGPEIVAAQERALERIHGALDAPTGSTTSGTHADALVLAADHARERFVTTMDADFNTAGALAVLFELVRQINTARTAGVAGEPFATAQATLRDLCSILGLTLERPTIDQGNIAPLIELLLETRQALRQAKQYALADTIRKRLAELGYTLEDGPNGTTWQVG